MCTAVTNLLDLFQLDQLSQETSDVLMLKLFFAELAQEGVIQVELKTFNNQDFMAVYQAYLNAGLLKSQRDEELRYVNPSLPQQKDPDEVVMDFSEELHFKLLEEFR